MPISLKCLRFKASDLQGLYFKCRHYIYNFRMLITLRAILIRIVGLIVTFSFCHDNRISTKGQVF